MRSQLLFIFHTEMETDGSTCLCMHNDNSLLTILFCKMLGICTQSPKKTCQENFIAHSTFNCHHSGNHCESARVKNDIQYSVL